MSRGIDSTAGEWASARSESKRDRCADVSHTHSARIAFNFSLMKASYSLVLATGEA
jgi:hypothetical protein